MLHYQIEKEKTFAHFCPLLNLNKIHFCLSEYPRSRKYTRFKAVDTGP